VGAEASEEKSRQESTLWIKNFQANFHFTFTEILESLAILSGHYSRTSKTTVVRECSFTARSKPVGGFILTTMRHSSMKWKKDLNTEDLQ